MVDLILCVSVLGVTFDGLSHVTGELENLPSLRETAATSWNISPLMTVYVRCVWSVIHICQQTSWFIGRGPRCLWLEWSGFSSVHWKCPTGAL